MKRCGSALLSALLVAIPISASQGQTLTSLAGLDYHAVTTLEGFAPSKIVSTVTISNRGELPVNIEFGACAVKLFAFRSPDKTGTPAWISNPSDMCILPLYMRLVAPGHSTSLNVTVPTRDMMKDPIPRGQYFFTAQVELTRKKITMDAGTLMITGTAEPLPTSRTVDSIQFSSSVKRISRGSGIPDSLEVMFVAHNDSHVTRTIRSNTRCIGIMGYKSRERRDLSYSRPAYENDWFVRPCAMPAIPFDVVPGRVHVSFKRIAAPPESMFYTLYLEFFDNAFPTRDSYFVDLAADEGTSL